MFEIYEVEAWLIGLPWVLLGITSGLLWWSVVCGKRWMRWHDLAKGDFDTVRSLIEAKRERKSCTIPADAALRVAKEFDGIISIVSRAEKAEASAREADAGNREANRRLEVSEFSVKVFSNQVDELKREIVAANKRLAAVIGPYDARKSPAKAIISKKTKKTAPKKKITKSLAFRKRPN